jgi:hypothetical protein
MAALPISRGKLFIPEGSGSAILVFFVLPVRLRSGHAFVVNHIQNTVSPLVSGFLLEFIPHLDAGQE